MLLFPAQYYIQFRACISNRLVLTALERLWVHAFHQGRLRIHNAVFSGIILQRQQSYLASNYRKSSLQYRMQ